MLATVTGTTFKLLSSMLIAEINNSVRVELMPGMLKEGDWPEHVRDPSPYVVKAFSIRRHVDLNQVADRSSVRQGGARGLQPPNQAACNDNADMLCDLAPLVSPRHQIVDDLLVLQSLLTLMIFQLFADTLHLSHAEALK